MLEITDYLLAPEITPDEVAHLKVLIETHHSAFVEIDPDSSILPKMHYLVHIPRLIIRFGIIHVYVVYRIMFINSTLLFLDLAPS